MVRLFVLFVNQEMKKICNKIASFLIVISLVSCIGNPQDSPQSIADTYAQCMCEMDIEGLVSCFEYGEEAMGFLEDYLDYEDVDLNLNDLQRVVSAAKDSELVPVITYEIVEEKIEGDKGKVRIRFDFEYDDGEEVHTKTDYEEISVYCHEGLWWIGEGYSKKERELGRRIMNFFDKMK